MLIMSFFGWWYGSGYRGLIQKVGRNLDNVADQFSIVGLLTTLFAPFKQIDVNYSQASAPLDVKLKLWGNRLFSRVFGFFVRLVTIIAGLVVLMIATLVALIRVAFWPLIPLLPIFGVLLSIIGWFPWL